MPYNSLLFEIPTLEFKNGLYFDRRFNPSPFADVYGAVRSLEGRAYTDEVVRRLPAYRGTTSLENEWSQRGRSAQRLANYLLKRGPRHVIEIGCGNGWLTNYLSAKTGIPCCGIDINVQELEQAVRVFGGNQKVSFLALNVEQSSIPLHPDFVVMAASSQYFPKIRTLIERILKQMDATGEIHLLDSPFYPSRESALAARERSKSHFERLGQPGMTDHYFHNTLSDLEGLDYSLLHDPDAVMQRFSKFFRRDSVRFPWLRIRKIALD